LNGPTIAARTFCCWLHIGPELGTQNAIDDIEWAHSYYQGILSMVSDRPEIE
jgi:hypothetical protein